MLARGLMRASGKVLIAPAAASTLGNDDALIGPSKIVDLFAGRLIVDNRAHWDLEYNAFTLAAGAVGAFTVASALALVFRIKAELDQPVLALFAFHDNSPPTPP